MSRAIGAVSSVAFSAVVACVLLAGACAARAQDLDRPLLLVAKPDLQGPYMHTALLVVPLGDQHFGFILNRASELTLAKLYPQHARSAKVADPVYLGGPEMPQALFALTARDPGKPSMRLFGSLYLTADEIAIDRIIERAPNEARFFAGFVGWQPQELADEIEAGLWYVAAADESLVFRADTSSLWDELVGQLDTERHAQLGHRYGSPGGAVPGGVGMPTIATLERMERDLRKPVVSAAAAMMWNALGVAGVSEPLTGFGGLLAQKR